MVVFALALPWLSGLALLRPFGRAAAPDPVERAGVGALLGALWITGATWAAGHLGAPLDRRWAFGIALAPLVLSALPRSRAGARELPSNPSPFPGGRVALAVVLVTLVLTFLLAAAENLLSPLRAADALTVWGLRARVWFENHSILATQAGGDPVGQAIPRPYPPHVSLLQAWTAACLGRWDERLITLPWLGYHAALTLVAFGAVRPYAGPAWALAAALLASTTPLVTVHAALGGYADLPLATHFAAAGLVLYGWLREPRAGRLALGLVLAASLPWIKTGGLVLGPLAASALLLRVPRRWRAPALGVALAVGVLAVVAIALHPLTGPLLRTPRWDPAAWRALGSSLFAHGNWNLLWFVLLAAAAARARPLAQDPPLAWLLAVVTAAALAWVLVLTFTPAAAFAGDQTLAGRLFLHIAPAAGAWIALVAGIHGPANRSTVPRARRAAARRRPRGSSSSRRPGTTRALVAAAGALVAALATWLVTRAGGPSRVWTVPGDGWVIGRAGARLSRHLLPGEAAGSAGIAIRTRYGHERGPIRLLWSDGGKAYGLDFTLDRRQRWRWVPLRGQPGWGEQTSALAVVGHPALLGGLDRVDLEARGTAAAVHRAWQDLRTPRLLGDEAVNFLWAVQVGPLPLEIVAALAVALAVLTAGRGTSSDRRWKVAALAVTAAWIGCHARFLADLGTTTWLDRVRFGPPSAARKDIDLVADDIDHLRRAVADVLPPRAPVLVFSALDLERDGAQYYFYPHPVRNWTKAAAGRSRRRSPAPVFALLLHPAPNRFDPVSGRLRLDSGRNVPARVVSHPTPETWIVALRP